MSNGRAYGGKHDGKIGVVYRDAKKISDRNITIKLDYDNPNSQYGLWYVDSKYLLKVKEYKTEDILSMTQSEGEAYAKYKLEEFQKYSDKMINFEQELNVKWSNKKEERNMKTIGILDLWKKNEDEKDKQLYTKAFDELLFRDIHFSFLKTKVDEINSYLIENKLSESNVVRKLVYTSEKTNAEIEKLKEIREDYNCKINALYNEIKTMLSACDTYEQETDVLKAYGIVDGNGILVKE